MEKELAMQESLSVEETNKQLKEQIAKLGWPEVQGVTSSSASQQMEEGKESKKIICDKLTKRVSDMSSDNDMLKMHVHWKQEKELAMQGYMSLEQPDKKLKEQVAKTVRPEVQGVASSAASQQMEDEKEAKKIRRMLANRESARESIRRRQAIPDELAKRVSDLSSEHDKLKMEKELAMQESLLVEETNKQLKEQIAKLGWPEVQGVASSSASQQMEDEKESKKIICDKLTKRVSDMSSDNDMLKMEKLLAMQGYMSLEQPDKKLKEQIAKTVRPEVQGVASSAASQQTEEKELAMQEYMSFKETNKQLKELNAKTARHEVQGVVSSFAFQQTEVSTSLSLRLPIQSGLRIKEQH